MFPIPVVMNVAKQTDIGVVWIASTLTCPPVPFRIPHARALAEGRALPGHERTQ